VIFGLGSQRGKTTSPTSPEPKLEQTSVCRTNGTFVPKKTKTKKDPKFDTVNQRVQNAEILHNFIVLANARLFIQHYSLLYD
jgi:hypothetical protein